MNKNMMRLFSNYLYDPNIWHVHRRSSAGGAAIGVFCAFIPLPIQTFGFFMVLSFIFGGLIISLELKRKQKY